MYIKVEGIEKLLDEAFDKEKETYYNKLKVMKNDGLFEGRNPNLIYATFISEAIEDCVDKMSGNPQQAVRSLVILSIITMATGFAFAKLENEK